MAGNLHLQFADANRIGAVNIDGGGGGGLCAVLEIRPLSIDDVVVVDETTFSALQIFAADAPPASGSRKVYTPPSLCLSLSHKALFGVLLN